LINIQNKYFVNIYYIIISFIPTMNFDLENKKKLKKLKNNKKFEKQIDDDK